MPVNESWEEWYTSVTSALKTFIERAAVDWETDAEGNPWVVLGQRRPKGVDYPHAMVMSFTKQRQSGTSMRSNELHDLQVDIANFILDDARTPEQNLLKALGDMGAIEDEIYDDRSLGGACEKATVTQSDAFEMESANGHESVGHIQVSIDKHAEV